MRISDWSSDVCSSDLVPNSPDFDHTGKIMRFTVASSASTPSVKLPAAGAPLFAAAPAMDQDLPLNSPVAARRRLALTRTDRKSVVEGKGGAVRVMLGGARLIKKKTTHKSKQTL